MYASASWRMEAQCLRAKNQEALGAEVGGVVVVGASTQAPKKIYYSACSVSAAAKPLRSLLVGGERNFKPWGVRPIASLVA